MPDDLDDALRKDYEKFRTLQDMGDGDGLSLTAKMEYTFWGLAILSVIGMIVTMFFAGPQKPISGRLWLFGSLSAICAFGGLALVVRQLPEV